MLRFHLPPNFAAAARRDAVPIRVELDLNVAPDPAALPALALLQRWCGTPTPPKFIQLTRAQLRELASAAGKEPLFVENGRALAWQHASIVAEQNTAVTPAATSVLSPPSPKRSAFP